MVLEPSKGFMFQPQFMPSYVNVNLGAEEKSIRVWNLCMEKNKETHDWLFYASMIRGVRYIYFKFNKPIDKLIIYSLFVLFVVCIKEMNGVYFYMFMKILTIFKCISHHLNTVKDFLILSYK